MQVVRSLYFSCNVYIDTCTVLLFFRLITYVQVNILFIVLKKNPAKTLTLYILTTAIVTFFLKVFVAYYCVNTDFF